MTTSFGSTVTTTEPASKYRLLNSSPSRVVKAIRDVALNPKNTLLGKEITIAGVPWETDSSDGKIEMKDEGPIDGEIERSGTRVIPVASVLLHCWQESGHLSIKASWSSVEYPKSAA